MKKNLLLLILVPLCAFVKAQSNLHVVKNLKITILSTMLAEKGVGEWGFSALVQADSSNILFDSGGRPNIVLDNAKELGVDLSLVRQIVLSHSHGDHTAGWIPLRQQMSVLNKSAFSVTYVAPEFFLEHLSDNGNGYSRKPDSINYAKTGGKIMIVPTWKEISPGLYLTGSNFPRVTNEKNFPVGYKLRNASGKVVDDTVPEDMSMVIATKYGLVLITGCGHAGVVNIITAIKKKFPGQRIYAAIGGFHLLADTDEQIKWTAENLKNAGVRYFMGAHCTGMEPVYKIKNWAGLKNGECIVGSVGSSFDLTKGFTAGPLTMGRNKN